MGGDSKIGHVGLTVSDLERSLRFYRDLLGLKEIDRNEFAEASFGKLTNNPGAHIRTAMLGSGALLLQLVEYVHGGGERMRLDHRNAGTPHLSFQVEDLDRTFEEMRRRGVEITSDIVPITREIRSFYVADPDGVPVELMEGAYP